MTQVLPWNGRSEGSDVGARCVYVPGLVINSIMNCGGPSHFLRKPKSDSVLSLRSSVATMKPAEIAAIHQYIMTKGRQTLQAIAKEEIPEACIVRQWLENGSINAEVIEILKKKANLRRSSRTTVISLPSRTHSSLPSLSNDRCTRDIMDPAVTSQTALTDQIDTGKDSCEVGVGWPQEPLNALSRWWCNGWWIFSHFILNYAGRLLKNKNIDLS